MTRYIAQFATRDSDDYQDDEPGWAIQDNAEKYVRRVVARSEISMSGRVWDRILCRVVFYCEKGVAGKS